MKIFILALDGLEYDLVKLWNLLGLRQKTCGKIKLSKEYYISTRSPLTKMVEVTPYTPIVWASFITGLPPRKHGIRQMITYGNFLNKLRNAPLIRNIKAKRKILWKMGLKPRLVSKKDLSTKTLFDLINPSIAIDIPAYNESTEYHYRLLRAFSKDGIVKYEKEVWNIFNERKAKLFREIIKPWKLFMVYFKITDLLGHLYVCKNPSKLSLVYKEVNKLAKTLQHMVSTDTIFLIVSDHGVIPSADGVTGTHSDHAFWSLNMKISWKPKDIIDFYPKILEWSKKQ